MVEPSDRGWSARVTRRGILALPLVLGVGSCTQLSAINDKYIATMKKDPIFAWEPPMPVTRTINYSPRDGTFERTSRSSIVIWLTPKDPRQVPVLLEAAEQARTEAGYSDRDRRLGGKDDGLDFWIECDISANGIRPGEKQNPVGSDLFTVQIMLSAPLLEP